jgi:hippurate hydrolase
MPKIMGSEDFQHLVTDLDGHRYVYMLVGTAQPEHCRKAEAEGKLFPYANHNPDYQVDLDAIPLGAKIGAASVVALLAA